MKWLGFSVAGRERLRAAALASRPWEHSTGPRTAEGKARSAENGRSRQEGPISARRVRSEADVLIRGLQAVAKMASDSPVAGEQDQGDRNTEVNCG